MGMNPLHPRDDHSLSQGCLAHMLLLSLVCFLWPVVLEVLFAHKPFETPMPDFAENPRIARNPP